MGLHDRCSGLDYSNTEEIPGSRFGQQHFYRKAKLFERLLAFDVHVYRPEEARR